ncbi:MAG: autotransporter domain-containing protein [Burkholderiaceae bacterium]|nr:autotransporter domain-containing protein [Burkholderiaceae bacterium]
MTHLTFRRACTWLPMILATAGGTAQASNNLASIQREAEQLQRDIQRQGERIERVGADIDRRMGGHIARIDQIIERERNNRAAFDQAFAQDARGRLQKIERVRVRAEREVEQARQATEAAENAFQAQAVRIENDSGQTAVEKTQALATLAAARDRHYTEHRAALMKHLARFNTEQAELEAAFGLTSKEIAAASEYDKFVQTNDSASRKGVRRSVERTVDEANVQDARSYRSDYTRLQGAGLLLSESMLGSMDDRWGSGASASDTDKRGWVRIANASEGGGGAGRPNAGFRNNGSRYQAGAFQLGADLYRTASDRAGVFMSGGYSSFGNGPRHGARLLEVPNVSGVALGGYYNHTSATGWYVDGAMQLSRLRGEFGQYGERFVFDKDTANHRVVRNNEKVKSAGMGFALQGEVGYRYAMNRGVSMTPKLRLDHHRIRLSGANGTKELGSTSFDSLGKTGIYYALRMAQEMETSRGTLNLWVEPGISHTLGAKAKQTHTNYFDKRRLQTERNLNATRLGLKVGIDGDITKTQSLRFEAGMTKGLGRKNGMGHTAMAAWSLKF